MPTGTGQRAEEVLKAPATPCEDVKCSKLKIQKTLKIENGILWLICPRPPPALGTVPSMAESTLHMGPNLPFHLCPCHMLCCQHLTQCHLQVPQWLQPQLGHSCSWTAPIQTLPVTGTRKVPAHDCPWGRIEHGCLHLFERACSHVRGMLGL